jgi:tetratricopeptide (TPR) repeat protein/predicted Ser/Thr protein kinase
MIGQTIAHFQIIEKLGEGGMGIVYRALDNALNRPVALKFLMDRGHDERTHRFLREARAASALNHPNIVTVHEIGEVEDGRFIVMEWIDGMTLRAWKREPRALDAVLSVATQVAKALAAAHAAGIVHRDIKPENIMVRQDGYVKVLDFGLARQLVNEEAKTLTATQPGVLLGTMRYMSPEQSRGEAASSASDIFSFGLVLYELLGGRHPFHADSTIGVLHGIQLGAPAPLHCQAGLNELVLRMMEKDARLRPTAAEVAACVNDLPALETPTCSFSHHRDSVGREHEHAELRAAFDAANHGSTQIVGIAGEPGIGKSTLAGDFLAGVNSPIFVARGSCSERLAGAEAHLPFLEALDSLLEQDPTVSSLMRELAPGWLHQIAPLSANALSDSAPAAGTKTGSAERLMREMTAFLQELARRRTVVLFIDDLHWADLSTIDLLACLAQKLTRTRALLLLTYRPSDLSAAKHPFLRLRADFAARGTLREISVAFLTLHDVQRYVSQHLPEAPAALPSLIYKKTEGNPLFMVDLVRYLRKRPTPAVWSDEIERNIPESLRGMIERKLEQLDDESRNVLRVAAVQGFQFDSAIIAELLVCDPAEIEDVLQSLDRVHGVLKFEREHQFPNGVFSLRYQFVHVLYQNQLYASLSPSRRAAWSGKVAGALEAAYGSRKNTIAAELALLYEMAREPWRASEHFLAAAEMASNLFANREAVALARRGLSCLTSNPPNPGTKHRELALQKTLLIPLAALEGYGSPAAERVSERVIELSEELQDTDSLFAALTGAVLVHVGRAECPAAAQTAERMLAVAEQSSSEVQQVNARLWMAIIKHHMGELAAAQHHADICIALGVRQNQSARLTGIFDPVVGALAESSRNLWMMGETRRCLQNTKEAIALAREVRHPESLSFALLFHGWMHGYQEDWETSIRSSSEAISVCEEHGLIQTMAWNHTVHGWALAHQAGLAEGLVELETAIESSQKVMGQVAMSHFACMLAEVLILLGRHTQALDRILQILKANETSRDLYFNAELCRLAGECHVAMGDQESAMTAYQEAIETAQSQGAKLFELRAGTSLGRLLAGSGQRRAAKELLQRICDRFNDAEEMVDLARARECIRRWD